MLSHNCLFLNENDIRPTISILDDKTYGKDQ